REAIAAFDRAASLGDELLAARGGTEVLPEILARTYSSAAVVFMDTGRTEDALRAALRAQALAEQAARARPGDPSASRTRLRVAIQAAGLLQARGRAEARHLCEATILFGRARVPA